MNFLLRNLEAAQEQARSLSISAGTSARGFAEHLSEQTKVFAEQAASVSSVAAQQASQRWNGLNLQETLQLKSMQSSGTAEKKPSKEELEEYAITGNFVEFIKSLTYSTFRDFPLDELLQPEEGDETKVLTPWQEKHALLVVQEVKEINELRFVLCPKRMDDSQFWLVYFCLAKKYLPPEAFEKGDRTTKPSQPGSLKNVSNLTDLSEFQTNLKRGLEAARETAREWSSRASGTLRPAETSAQLHDLVESRSRGTTPTAVSGVANTSQPFGRPANPGAGRGPDLKPRVSGSESDMDTELEAYLQTIKSEAEHQHEHVSGEGNDNSSEEAEDLDEYLNALNLESNEKENESSQELEEYMKDY